MKECEARWFTSIGEKSGHAHNFSFVCMCVGEWNGGDGWTSERKGGVGIRSLVLGVCHSLCITLNEGALGMGIPIHTQVLPHDRCFFISFIS